MAETQLESGWVEPSLREEFRGLGLRYTVVEVRSGRSPRELRARLRHLSDRVHGERVLNLRREPIASSYRVFFRQASNDRTEWRGTNGVRGPGEDGQFPLKRVNDAYVIDWISIISPTIIFNMRGSFSRYVEASRSDADLNFDLTTLGFPASLVQQLGARFGFGMYRLDSYINLGRSFSGNVTNTGAVHPTAEGHAAMADAALPAAASVLQLDAALPDVVSEPTRPVVLPGMR